jgi:hypothetical protein
MTVAHLDLETRSTCDLKTAGLYRYFEDPETEVLVERLRDEIKARAVRLAQRSYRGGEVSANLYELFECVKLAGFELKK